MFKKVMAALLVCMMVLLPSAVTRADDENYDYYDYYIQFYDVDVRVGEDNVFEITETIVACFNREKHGIIRTYLSLIML